MERQSTTTSSPAAREEFLSVEIADKLGSKPKTLRLAFARYPTTVENYQRFIEADGYRDPRWWSKRGAAWRRRVGICEPADWGRPGFDQPRMPVTGVSFWEAEAYAHFSNAELPTENEWYLVASNGGSTRYPWGDEDPGADTDRANLAFFGQFGRPERLPVDRSSLNASVHGICDLIGNAAEWCLPGARSWLARRQKFGVLRGGASWHVPGVADASFRDVVPLTVRDSQAGIRLVRREAGGLTTTDTGKAVANATRFLGRSIRRPTSPFRQEGIPPALTAASWRLALYGYSVAQPRDFSLTELKEAFPNVTDRGLYVCVCRWGQENTFTGVRLRDVLDACQVPWREMELYVLQKSAPGADARIYETTVPIRNAVENQALLAWAMDGEPLTHELGWPLRYIDWSLYGYKCVKCLTELVVTNEQRPGWWELENQYDIDGTIMPGTITVVGEEALRVEIKHRGRVCDLPTRSIVEPRTK